MNTGKTDEAREVGEASEASETGKESRSAVNKSSLLIVAGIAIVSLAALVWLIAGVEEPSGTTTLIVEPPAPVLAPEPAPPPIRIIPPAEQPAVPGEPPAAPESVVEVSPEVGAEPASSDEAEQAVAEVALPSLNESDAFVREQLQNLRNGAALLGLLADGELIRKFVVFVDNVSREEFPQTDLPYRPIGAAMPVRELDQNLFLMEADSHERFDAFIDAMVAVDVEQAHALYRLLRPLFQHAYAEIGYSGRDFDDTLRKAINNVLQASDSAGPYQLVKPSVMYLFADSELENADAVHKQLVRIGPRNSTRIMARLAEFVVLL